MAKRFTDTNKYKKPFIRSLTAGYKLFWDFLYHDCDHAGIWIVDFGIAKTYVGEDVVITRDLALKYFNTDEQRIVEIDHGKKWFIPSFIEFQYGHLSEKNKAHINVISILKKYMLIDSNLNIKPLVSPLQGAMEKETEEEKEMVMEEEKENFEKFEKLLIPEMMKVWKNKKPNYPVDKNKDFWALGEIAKFISDQLNIPYNPRDGDLSDKILSNWGVMADFISKTDHINSYNLGQVAKYSQTIVQKIQNGTSKNKSESSVTGANVDTRSAFDAIDKHFAKNGNHGTKT